HLTRDNDINRAETILSIGDDAAVIDHFGQQTVVSTDLLIEGVHFDLSYFPLKHLGYKSVVVNLSDIYAMNAEPTQITLSLAFSNRFSIEALDEFYEGVYAACEKYNVDLVGGDTTSSQKGLLISVTAIGKIPEMKYVSRRGAGSNDLICVSGDLGAAYLGLQLLEREKRIFVESPGVQPDLGNRKHTIGRFLKPEPRADVIKWLAENNITPTSMIDLSDGLSSELLHLHKGSNKGLVVYEEKIPIHVETAELAEEFNINPLVSALNGGEDYELLFSVSQSDFEKIKNCALVSVIGHFTEEGGTAEVVTTANNKYALKAQGWNAFQK